MDHTKPDSDGTSDKFETTLQWSEGSRVHSDREIVPCGRAIFIVGPSSSGKTTLHKAVATQCGVPPWRCIGEVARTVMRERGFTRRDTNTFEMQMAIMTAQIRAENNIFQAKAKEKLATAEQIFLLSDRSAIDPIIYAGMLGTKEALQIQSRLGCLPEFKRIIPSYRRALFVVLAPVPEWIEDDGVRSLEDPWKYWDRLRNLLGDLNIPFREIGEDVKDIDSRVTLVREWASSRIEL